MLSGKILSTCELVDLSSEPEIFDSQIKMSGNKALSFFKSIKVELIFFREIGPRSKVWSEKEMVDAAAYEFAEVH